MAPSAIMSNANAHMLRHQQHHNHHSRRHTDHVLSQQQQWQQPIQDHLYAIPELSCQGKGGEDEEGDFHVDPAANGDSSGLCGEEPIRLDGDSTHEKLMRSLNERRSTGDGIQGGECSGCDLENDETESDIVFPPSKSNVVAHEHVDDAEIAIFKESLDTKKGGEEDDSQNDARYDSEFIEEYEVEIQRLEKLNATLTANVATLTAAALNPDCNTDVDRSAPLAEGECCGTDRKSGIKVGAGTITFTESMIDREQQILPPPTDEIYNDMILTEEHYLLQISKLQKANNKLQRKLDNKKRLIAQLSMNLKTAAEKITIAGKEGQGWKTKFCELQIQGEDQSRKRDEERRKDEEEVGAARQIQLYQLQVLENELTGLLELIGRRSEAHAKARRRLLDVHSQQGVPGEWMSERPEETLQRVIQNLRGGGAATRSDERDTRTTGSSPGAFNVWDSVTSLFGGPGHPEKQQQQQQKQKHQWPRRREHPWKQQHQEEMGKVIVDEHPMCVEVRTFDKKDLRGVSVGTCDEDSGNKLASACTDGSSSDSPSGISSGSSIGSGKSNLHEEHTLTGAGELCHIEKATAGAHGKGRGIMELLSTQACSGDFVISPSEGTPSIQQYPHAKAGLGANVGLTAHADSIARSEDVGALPPEDGKALRGNDTGSNMTSINARKDTEVSQSDGIQDPPSSCDNSTGKPSCFAKGREDNMFQGQECLFETLSTRLSGQYCDSRGRSSFGDGSKHEEDDAGDQSTGECTSVIDDVDDGVTGKLTVRSGHSCDALSQDYENTGPLEGGIQHCLVEQMEDCSPVQRVEGEAANVPWKGWGLAPPLCDVTATSNINYTEKSKGSEDVISGTSDGEVMIDQHKHQQGEETQGQHKDDQQTLVRQQTSIETKSDPSYDEAELPGSHDIIPNAPFKSDDDSSEPESESDTEDDGVYVAGTKQMLSCEQQFSQHHQAEEKMQNIETKQSPPDDLVRRLRLGQAMGFLDEVDGLSDAEVSGNSGSGGNSHEDQLEATDEGSQCTKDGAKDGTEPEEGRCCECPTPSLTTAFPCAFHDKYEDHAEEEDLSHVGDIILSKGESEVEATMLKVDQTACSSTTGISFTKEGLNLAAGIKNYENIRDLTAKKAMSGDSCERAVTDPDKEGKVFMVNDESNEMIDANGGNQDEYPCSQKYDTDDDGSVEVLLENNDIKMDCDDARKECLGQEDLATFNGSRGYTEDLKLASSKSYSDEEECTKPEREAVIEGNATESKEEQGDAEVPQTNVLCAPPITLGEGVAENSVSQSNEGYYEHNQSEVSEFAPDNGGHFEQEQDLEGALDTKGTLDAKSPGMSKHDVEHSISTRQSECCEMVADGDRALNRSIISPSSEFPLDDDDDSNGIIRTWRHAPLETDNVDQQTFIDESNIPFAESMEVISIARNTWDPNDNKSDAEMFIVSSISKGHLQSCFDSVEISQSISRMGASYDDSDEDGYVAREAKDEDGSSQRVQPEEINVSANSSYIDEDYNGEYCVSGDESSDDGDEPDALLASKSEKTQRLQEQATTSHQSEGLIQNLHERHLNEAMGKTQPKVKAPEETSHESGHAGDAHCGEEHAKETQDEMLHEKESSLDQNVGQSDHVTSNIDQLLSDKEPASSFSPTGGPVSNEASIPSSINVIRQTKRRSSPTGTIASCSATAISAGTQARISAALEKKFVRCASHHNAKGVQNSFVDTLEKVKEQNKDRIDGPDTTDRSPAYYQNVISQYTAPTKKKDDALSNRLPRRELFQRQGSSCSDLYVDIVTDVFHKPEDRQVLVTSRDIGVRPSQAKAWQVPRYQPPILPPNFKRTGPSAPSFKKGHKDGYYIYKSSSGNEYIGHWKDGRRHGYGTARYRDGEIFNGEWRRGRRNGHGVLHLANSEVFDGYWCANKKHGLGVYYWSDGEVDVSWYEDDARVESLRWTKDRRRAYMLDLESSRKDQISLVRAASIVKGWERKGETYDC